MFQGAHLPRHCVPARRRQEVGGIITNGTITCAFVITENIGGIRIITVNISVDQYRGVRFERGGDEGRDGDEGADSQFRTCVCGCACVSVSASEFVSVFACQCVSVCGSVYVCVCVRECVRECLCVFMCVYTQSPRPSIAGSRHELGVCVPHVVCVCTLPCVCACIVSVFVQSECVRSCVFHTLSMLLANAMAFSGNPAVTVCA